MVQKSVPGERPPTKRRGRPPAYKAEKALQQATRTFWTQGYSGTSLDDIAAATAMNRPSLYAAFGNKRSLYLSALEAYWGQGYAAMREALSYEESLPEALMRVYDRALALYLPEEGKPLGCFAIGTGVTEAPEDEAIAAAMVTGLSALDDFFEARIRAAQENEGLRQQADPAALAILASATLHTIAIRARIGVPRAELERIARAAVAVICAA